jgi:hypothetical protein
MKTGYGNLYTCFVFTAINRIFLILENIAIGLKNTSWELSINNGCKTYSIYTHASRIHFLVPRFPSSG